MKSHYTVDQKKLAELNLKLHDLIAAGECDSKRADDIRDYMDDLHYRISPERRERLDGLMGDLYMLMDEDFYYKSEAKDKLLLIEELCQKIRDKDWIGVPKILQGSIGLPRFLIAYYRGMAYAQLSPRIAQRFFDFSKQLKEKWA